MSRTKTFLILLAVLGLAGLSLYVNRDWFADRPIQISYRVSPWLKDLRRGRSRPAQDLGVPVVFSLNTYYRFLNVKVLIAAEIATNKYAHPLWEMVTQSNSVPTASFSYGERIRGMLPKVKGATPDPLQPGVTYRLVLTTTDNKEAQHDFSTTPPAPPAPPADQPAK